MSVTSVSVFSVTVIPGTVLSVTVRSVAVLSVTVIPVAVLSVTVFGVQELEPVMSLMELQSQQPRLVQTDLEPEPFTVLVADLVASLLGRRVTHLAHFFLDLFQVDLCVSAFAIFLNQMMDCLLVIDHVMSPIMPRVVGSVVRAVMGPVTFSVPSHRMTMQGPRMRLESCRMSCLVCEK